MRFLPTSSPDLHPTEQALARLKQYLRAAKARSGETVFAATTERHPCITATDAHAFFRQAGYSL